MRGGQCARDRSGHGLQLVAGPEAFRFVCGEVGFGFGSGLLCGVVSVGIGSTMGEVATDPARSFTGVSDR